MYFNLFKFYISGANYFSLKRLESWEYTAYIKNLLGRKKNIEKLSSCCNIKFPLEKRLPDNRNYIQILTLKTTPNKSMLSR